MLVLCLAAPALPASAELYRWIDAQGREHFAMDLHEVPPEHRAAAQRRVELEKIQVDRPPEPTINTMKTPDGVAVKRALRPRYPRSPRGGPAAATTASAQCDPRHRQRAAKLELDVETWAKKIDLAEEKHRRLVRTEDRLEAENRIEIHELSLARAEQALEDFESQMREKGVPPGCLR